MYLHLVSFLCAALVTTAVDTEPEPTRRLVKCVGHTDFVNSVAVSPDGRLVISAGDDQTIRFWKSTDGKAIRTIQPIKPVRGGLANAIAFAPDGKTFAAHTSESEIQFYDAATGTPKKGMAINAGGYRTAYSPDGKTFAFANNKGVKVWDPVKGKLLHEFTFGAQLGQAWRVAFSPDGKHLAAALHSFGREEKGGHLARVWDLTTGKEVFSTWHGGHANAVAFSPDGKLLAIGGENDGRVEVHDWAKKQRLVRFQADKHVVFCLAFSRDGKTLYTGGNDPQVKLWDPTTGKSVGKLEGNTDQVADLALSRNGRVLATAGRDRRVLIWRLDAKGR